MNRIVAHLKYLDQVAPDERGDEYYARCPWPSCGAPQVFVTHAATATAPSVLMVECEQGHLLSVIREAPETRT